jgi:hypothetical protein
MTTYTAVRLRVLSVCGNTDLGNTRSWDTATLDELNQAFQKELDTLPDEAKADLQEGSCDKTQQADIASYKGISLGFFPPIISVFIFCISTSALYCQT